jgi:hypothetical protein
MEKRLSLDLFAARDVTVAFQLSQLEYQSSGRTFSSAAFLCVLHAFVLFIH